MQHLNLSECDYDRQYYEKKRGGFKCKSYRALTCKTNRLRKTSTSQLVCETNTAYKKQTTNTILPLLHENVRLTKSYNDCATLCDNRQGCLGIDFNIQTNKCLFYGYETCKLVVENILPHPFNIKIYDNNDKLHAKYNGPTGKKGLEDNVSTKIFDPAVSLKKITLNTTYGFKGTVKLYDFENNLQKVFSNIDDDKDENATHIARYETSPNTYELRFFYTTE